MQIFGQPIPSPFLVCAAPVSRAPRAPVIFAMAMDRAPEGIAPRRDLMGRGGLPYSKDSVRTKDQDGRLHVAKSNISKAGVNPYLGREIPNYEKLGLSADKVYKLLRDPEELAKAAPSFNNQPLLSRHVPVSAEDHQSDLVVGSTGSQCAFDAPYLTNDLVIWSQGGIDVVESEEQKELSSAYHYDADMTPGEYEGEKYDGVMRNIRGNHVALVAKGRAGSDVVVGDEALPDQHGEVTMSKTRMMTRKASVAAGALMVALKPSLAQDSKLDLSPILLKAKPGKFGTAKKTILSDLKKALGGVTLAQDADIGEIIEAVADVIEAIDGDKSIVDDPLDGSPNTALDSGPLEKAMEYLRSKGVADEILEGLGAAMADGASDEFPDGVKKEAKKDEEDDKKQPKPDAEKDKKPAMDGFVSKADMDRAVKAASDKIMKDHREIAEAREAVRPVVGAIAMDAACGADVYRAALEAMGVEGAADLHADALRPVFDATKKPAPTTHTTKSVVAMDAAAQASFATRYPGATTIKRM